MTDGEHYRAIKEALSALCDRINRAEAAGMAVRLGALYPSTDICAGLKRASLSITRTVKDDTP